MKVNIFMNYVNRDEKGVLQNKAKEVDSYD